MIEKPNRFSIEKDQIIKETNFINDIFSDTTINNSVSSSEISNSLQSNFDKLNAGLSLPKTLLTIKRDKLSLTKRDLIAILENIFGKSAFFERMKSLITLLTDLEMKLLNTMAAIGRLIDKIVGPICDLLEALAGLVIGIPLLLIVGGLSALSIILSDKCRAAFFYAIMDAIDSEPLKKLIIINIIDIVASDNHNVGATILTDVINHPAAENIEGQAPNIATEITSSYTPDIFDNGEPYEYKWTPVADPNELDITPGDVIKRAVPPDHKWKPMDPDVYARLLAGLNNILLKPDKINVSEYTDAYVAHATRHLAYIDDKPYDVNTASDKEKVRAKTTIRIDTADTSAYEEAPPPVLETTRYAIHAKYFRK